MHLIPADYNEFYLNLKSDANIDEDIDGYNVKNHDFELDINFHVDYIFV